MLFSGDKAVVYGILKGPSELMSPVDCTASLKGQVLGKPLEYSIPFEVPGNSPSFPIPIIHHLAAKALIKDWERDGGDKKSEIVKLSIESSVVSSHTAFVAVDESNQPVKGAMKTWDITAKMEKEMDCDLSSASAFNAPAPGTVMMCMSAAPPKKRGGGLLSALSSLIPSGGKGGSSAKARKSKSAVKMAAPSPSPQVYSSAPAACLFDAEDECAAPMRSYAMRSEMQEDLCCMKESESLSGPDHSARGGDSLSSLVSLQQADGSWKLDDVIAKVLSKSLKELRDACPVKCDGGVATIWATVLCVVYLELKHPSQKDEWELIAMKADLWLDGQSLPAGADLNKMKEAAKKIIA